MERRTHAILAARRPQRERSMRVFLVNYAQPEPGCPDYEVAATSVREACEMAAEAFRAHPMDLFAVPKP